MTISVLMSVYRSERADNLDRALASVWTDQTLKPDQIVLIEDGPLGDALHQVIDKWRQTLGETLVILINADNIGLTRSLNKGLKAVTCDLIARMDSDDISAPARFELQHRYLLSHPEVAVVGGSVIEVNEKMECVNTRLYPPYAAMRVDTSTRPRPYLIRPS